MKAKLMIVVSVCLLMIFLAECQSKSAETNLPEIMTDEDRQKLTVVVKEKVYIPVDRTEDLETILTDDEKAVLAKVVHAEAGNQDMTGKRLVVDCVLNRVDCEKYPNHVWGVVLQEGQFVRAETYTDDDMAAVEKELMERLDYDVMYFRTNHYHNFGTPMYQHGDHYFSK